MVVSLELNPIRLYSCCTSARSRWFFPPVLSYAEVRNDGAFINVPDRDDCSKKISHKLRFILICAAAGSLSACGTSNMQSENPGASQTTYPSVPPLPITWSPSASPLPAPAANTTLPTWSGSTDFPLTVSSPQSNTTVTSPVNVVASATPKNPIFFMRVYDENSSDPSNSIADYFAFDTRLIHKSFLLPAGIPWS